MKQKKPTKPVSSLKSLRDFLKLAQSGRHELVFTYEVEDSGGGKVTHESSISFDQSEKGVRSLVPTQNLPLEAPESAEKLEERFMEIEKFVHEYISSKDLSEKWKEIEELIRSAGSTRQIAAELEGQALLIKGLSSRGFEAHIAVPALAWAYAVEGRAALQKGDLSSATHCASLGIHLCRADMVHPNPKERFSDRAVEGGKAKSEKTEPVKAKVAQLLVALAPKQGWKNLTAAIEVVTDELIRKHSDFVQGCGLNTSALPETIGEWIRADRGRFPYQKALSR